MHTNPEREVECMEKTRRKIWFFLLSVVIVAVICGAVYYFYSSKDTRILTEGTLISQFSGWVKGMAGYGR
mgnify:CR=1 FL=1